MATLREVAAAVESRHARKLARGTVDRRLPIFEGTIGARFGVLDPERLAEFERIGGEDYTPEQALDAAALFVADACRVVLAQSDPGGPWEPMTHDDGRPVLFDEDFAETFGLTLPGGRSVESSADVVLACWTVEEADGRLTVNAQALNVYSLDLLRWAQDTSQAVAGELAGESPAARQ